MTDRAATIEETLERWTLWWRNSNRDQASGNFLYEKTLRALAVIPPTPQSTPERDRASTIEECAKVAEGIKAKSGRDWQASDLAWLHGFQDGADDAAKEIRALAVVPPAPTDGGFHDNCFLNGRPEYGISYQTNHTTGQPPSIGERILTWIDAPKLSGQPDRFLVEWEHAIEGGPAPPSKHPDWDGVAGWMMKHGYATGHGDTVEDMLDELEAQAKRAPPSSEESFLGKWERVIKGEPAPPSIQEREKVLEALKELVEATYHGVGSNRITNALNTAEAAIAALEGK